MAMDVAKDRMVSSAVTWHVVITAMTVTSKTQMVMVTISTMRTNSAHHVTQAISWILMKIGASELSAQTTSCMIQRQVHALSVQLKKASVRHVTDVVVLLVALITHT